MERWAVLEAALKGARIRWYFYFLIYHWLRARKVPHPYNCKVWTWDVRVFCGLNSLFCFIIRLALSRIQVVAGGPHLKMLKANATQATLCSILS